MKKKSYEEETFARLCANVEAVAQNPTEHPGRDECAESVDSASGEPLSRVPIRTRLRERVEKIQGRAGLGHANRWILGSIGAAAIVVGGATAALSWPSSSEEEFAPVDAVAASSASHETGSTTIMVSVAGGVQEPGVVEIEPGARVIDAIKAAGGLSESADVGFMNLARPLDDGDLIAVNEGGDDEVVPPDGGDGEGDDSGDAGGLLNINSADAAQFTELTGIGPVLADRIVAYRNENGSFATVDELTNVSGIGPALLESIRESVAV
ncbi:helix-hairpin-helix domain-containing protein [Salininema proteolyticum]|uniref:Helix-hairpin-helix domain-containing protein n=1 Tax=Salininema proteolyticum TaxID=1607685 RepID=A0ABV8TVB7_9ACTN